MTETKWTLGPWCIDDFEITPGDLCEGCYGIFELGEDDPALAYVGPHGASKANAHLIAAAPDLYAATDWVEDDPVCCGPEQIRALIDARRKARGE